MNPFSPPWLSPAGPPKRPIWSGPPAYELGQPVAIAAIIGQSPTAVIAVRGLTAYSAGFTVEIVVRLSTPNYGLDPVGRHRFSRMPRSPDELLLGIELPDGSQATNADPPPDPYGSPPRVHIELCRGSGDAVGTDMTWWVWPLPPIEGINLTARWFQKGIDFSRIALDGEAIRSAATRSLELFE